MKVLLDECLPIAFRHSFPTHEVHTAEWAGFKGLKNGNLLREAERAGYAAFVTADQGILHQQNYFGLGIAIVVVTSPTNKIEDLLTRVQAIEQALANLAPGSLVRIP